VGGVVESTEEGDSVSEEFVPTTEQVRDGYADDGGQAEYLDPINGHHQRGESLKAFDRWLVEHDAEVAAAARARVMAVSIDVDTKSGEMLVNGETFPYYLAAEPNIVAEVGPNDMGVVTVPIVVHPSGSILFHHGEVQS
jgi:hypothetical protein